MRNSFFVTGIQLLVLLSLACKTYGQESTATGGRALGMAGTGIVLTDEFGLFNNPGAMEAQTTSFLASYHTQYLHLGLNDARFAIVSPLSRFNAGLGVIYYGDELFNQIKISSVLADQFGFARTGIKVNYHQYHVRNYGIKRAFTIDIGGVFTLSDQVQLALVFHNLTRSKLLGEVDNPLSSLLKIAVSYQPTETLRIDTQVTKTIENKPTVQIGLEYLLNDLIALRTGFSPSQSFAAFGTGFSFDSFELDLAGQYHQQIGYSGALSIIIRKKAE
ncbi:MAG: hypothetical protein ABFS32_04505 [Bacteroidota bacterium]